MNYLLDTHAMVALMRNKSAGVRERYRKAAASGDYLAVSSVVLFELCGTPIGAHDMLIAGQALRRGPTVVTANTSEFGRVSGLDWEDWTN